MFCPQCGNQMDDKAQFCGSCGALNAKPAGAANEATTGTSSAQPAPAVKTGSAASAAQPSQSGAASAVSAAAASLATATKAGANKLSHTWKTMDKKRRTLIAVIAAVVVVALLTVCGIVAGAANNGAVGLWQSWAYGDNGKLQKKVSSQMAIDKEGNITMIANENLTFAGKIEKAQQQSTSGTGQNDSVLYRITNISQDDVSASNAGKLVEASLSVPKKGFVGMWVLSYAFSEGGSAYTSMEVQKNGGLQISVSSYDPDDEDNNDSTRKSGSWRMTGSDKESVSYDITVDGESYAIKIPKAYKS